jgi:ankyrin repeat protein
MEGLLADAKRGNDGPIRAALFSKACLVTDTDKSGRTLLHAASQSGSAQLVRFLLEQGAAVNAIDSNNTCAVHFAASLPSADVMAVLVEPVFRASLDHQDRRGDTPLIIAARAGNLPVVQLLLSLPSERVNLDVAGQHGLNAVDTARKWERADAVAALEACRAARALAHVDPVEQLHAAARKGDVPGLRAALAAGARVNACDSNLRTVAHYAALFRQVAVLQALAELAPDIDFEARDKLERRPLHYCCFQPATLAHEAADNVDVVSFLVERARVDVPVKDASGDTPLVLAAFHGLARIITFLLTLRTAGLDVVGHGGLTAHDWAIKQGHLHVAALIAEAIKV